MSLLLAALLAGPGDLPAEMRWEDASSRLGGFLRIRGGVWAASGFEFEATRADSVHVESDGEAMGSGGVDLGFVIADHFVLLASADYSATDDTNAQTAGAAIGYRDVAEPGSSPGVPDEVMVYAGAFWGAYEVEKKGFGDFDDAVGFRAGISVTYRLSPAFSVSAVGEYRLIEFDYEEEVVEGDTFAGGSSAWVGLGLDLRF
jgi:hypothetical protein